MTDLLYSYTTTVKFLGSVLGPDYEVVLQDLSNINHSVIAIENGHISGRTIGSPLTSAVFQMLSSKVYEEDDFIANYKGVAENGHTFVLQVCSLKIPTEIRLDSYVLTLNDAAIWNFMKSYFR